MQLSVGPVDVVGNLWVIRPRGISVTPGEPLVLPDEPSDVRIVRHLAVDVTAAAAVEEQRCVSFFERPGTFAPRMVRIASRLAELGVQAEWHWRESAAPTPTIDDERAAVAWFLAHSADVLFVESIGFEKQRRIAPPWMTRLRWTSGAQPTPGRA